MRQSLAERAACEEGEGEILVADGEARLASDRLLVGGDGFGVAPGRLEGEAEVAVRVHPARLDVDRAAICGDGLVDAQGVAQEQAQVVVEIGDGAVLRHGLAHEAFRLAAIAARPGDQPQVVRGHGIARILAEHVAVEGLGLVDAAGLVELERALHALGRGRPSDIELAVALLVAQPAAARARVVAAGSGVHAARKSRTMRASRRRSSREAPGP